MVFPPTGIRLDPRNRRILPLNTYLHWGDHGGDSGAAERIWGIQGACQGREYPSPLPKSTLYPPSWATLHYGNKNSLCIQKCVALMAQEKYVCDYLLWNLSPPQIVSPNRKLVAKTPRYHAPDSGVLLCSLRPVKVKGFTYSCKTVHAL